MPPQKVDHRVNIAAAHPCTGHVYEFSIIYQRWECLRCGEIVTMAQAKSVDRFGR